MTSVVTFINLFEVPVGEDEQFLVHWRQVNDYAQGKDGYLGHKLHRAVSTATRYRYVNVAQWASHEQFLAAADDGFRALVSAAGWSRFASTPGLYEVVEGRG